MRRLYKKLKMVVVTREPETEPMLGAACSEELVYDANNKRNAYAEKAYRDLTSTMKAGPLQIKSQETGLNLLMTAIQLQDVTLANRCIEFLDGHLTKENVLMTYAHLQKCQVVSLSSNSSEPSAPPLTEEEENATGGADWVGQLTDSLRYNCLLLIDKHADYVLKQKQIVNITYQDLYEIVSRDTLQVSSELVVYSSVHSWGLAECARMTLNPQHLQEVLRHLRYAPRYGLMKRKEFKIRNVDGLKGPIYSGILDEKDWRRIKFYVEEKSKNRPVDELPLKMSRRRKVECERPKLLSQMSTTSADSQPLKGSYETHTKCDRCILNILTCWTAVFD